MDTRADFQRLLEDMDKVIQAKRQELSELDERLETARDKLSERDAKELSGYDYNEENQQSVANKKQIDELLREQKRFYDKQFNQLNEELLELKTINKDLLRENKSLAKLSNDLSDVNANLQSNLKTLQYSLKDYESANLELNLRLAKSERELMMQQKLLIKSHKEDEILLSAFNDKLESLKKAIEWRDNEIKRLKLDNQFTFESLGLTDTDLNDLMINSSSIGDNNQKVLVIVNAFREKDKQIDLLKQQLIQATKELEKNASLLEVANNQRSPTRDQRGREDEDQDDLLKRCKSLENELDLKDKQLHINESKLFEYEHILPNLLREIILKLAKKDMLPIDQKMVSDLEKLLSELNSTKILLSKIDQLNEEISDKNRQIEELAFDLTLLDAKLNDDKEQIELLDKVAEVSDKNNEKKLDIEGKSVENEGNTTRVITIPEALESKGSRIDKRWRKNKLVRLQENNMDKIDLKEIPVETVKEIEKLSEDKQLQTDFVETNDDRKLVDLCAKRREELENENELLELAMKEILLSIKWSDSRCSTILIDCPSLERLCQLIEAKLLGRSEGGKEVIDAHAFNQLIILKSELDLLRGQNEQLRSELKLQRKEYFEYVEDRQIRQEEFLRQSDERQSQLICSKVNADADDCRNCFRLNNLINQLLTSISSISERVQLNDDNYMARLLNLHKLIQILEKDLSIREKMLNESRRAHHLISKEKDLVKTRLDYLEQQTMVHMKICPIFMSSRLTDEVNNGYFKMSLTCENGFEGTTKQSNFMISEEKCDQLPQAKLNKLPIKNAKMIITLLKSIIGCLQARIDYKDERLRQLEGLLSKR